MPETKKRKLEENLTMEVPSNTLNGKYIILVSVEENRDCIFYIPLEDFLRHTLRHVPTTILRKNEKKAGAYNMKKHRREKMAKWICKEMLSYINKNRTRGEFDQEVPYCKEINDLWDELVKCMGIDGVWSIFKNVPKEPVTLFTTLTVCLEGQTQKF